MSRLESNAVAALLPFIVASHCHDDDSIGVVTS